MSVIKVFEGKKLVHQESFYDYYEAYNEAIGWANLIDQYIVKLYADGFLVETM